MPEPRSEDHAVRLVLSLRSKWGLSPHTALHVAALLVVHPDLRISSGRRSQERNRAVGGSETSFHLLGRAVDLTGPLEALRAAQQTVRFQRVGKGCSGPEEWILENPAKKGQHLHVAW